MVICMKSYIGVGAGEGGLRGNAPPSPPPNICKPTQYSEFVPYYLPIVSIPTLMLYAPKEDAFICSMITSYISIQQP